jgi:cytochrome c-type biogenesis protein CcmH
MGWQSMSQKSKNILLLGLLLAALGVVLLTWQPASAQDPQPTPSDNDVNRVAKQMYCPVCESTPLDVCPTQACQEWRDLIRLKLSEGWSDEQIKEYFVAQYGDRVLAEPPRRGMNWLLYVLPPIFMIAGAIFVWRLLVSMKHKPSVVTPPISAEPSSPEAAGSEDDLYLKKLEEELKKRE